MANYRNSGDGTSNGATVAAGDSYVDSSIPWDAVSIATAGTFIYDNTHVLPGRSLSYKIATGATSGVVYGEWSTGVTFAKPDFASACFYFTANPGATFRLASILTGSTVQGQLSLGTGGKFQAFDSTSTGAGLVFTNGIPLNAWFRVEFEIIAFSTTVGQYEVRLFLDPFGTTPTETQTSAASFNTGSTATPTRIRWGHAAVNTASQAAFWMAEAQQNTVSYPPAPTTQSAASGALTFGGTATPTAPGAATGVLTFSGTGTATAPSASAAGVLSFSGTPTATASSAAAAGALTFSGAPTAKAVASASGSITFTGLGTVTPAGSSATGVLSFSGTSTAAAKAAAASGLLSFAGTVTPKAAASAAGSITFGGTVTPRGPAAASGLLTFSGSGTANLIVVIPYETHGITLAAVVNSGATVCLLDADGTSTALPTSDGIGQVHCVTDGTAAATVADDGTVTAPAVVISGRAVTALDGTTDASTVSNGTGKAVVL